MPNVTTAEPGTVIEKNIRTRVLTKEEAGQDKEKNKYDPFELQDRMRAAGETWGDSFIAYIYRTDPPVFRGSNDATYVGKYSSFFSIEDIQKDYGGGRFRVLIKNGQERVADRTVNVAGGSRDLTRSLQEPGPTNGTQSDPSSATPSIVSQAMNLAANPAAQAAQIEMMKTAASTAVEMVKANAQQPMSTADIIALAKELSPTQKSFLEGPFGPIAIAVVTKLVDKLFTDPFENMARMAELASKFGGNSNASDWKAALVNATPQVINGITAGLHEIRLGAEATSQQRALPPAPVAVNPNAPANPPAAAPGQSKVVTMATPAVAQPPLPGTEPAQRMEVPMQFVWQKIFDFLNDASKTGADIGEFLDDLDPGFIASVKDYSVDQIATFVAGNPTIAYVAQHPRFKQCLAELLKWANEPDAPATPASPPTPVA